MVLFSTEAGLITTVRQYSPGSVNRLVQNRLVQSNANVTTDASSQVNFGLEIELDADQEGGLGVLALIVDGAAQELAYWLKFVRSRVLVSRGRGDPDIRTGGFWFHLPAGLESPEDEGSWGIVVKARRPPRA
jgi:hypothetical protein